MKRRLWGAESRQTHGFSCECIWWHLNPKCHQSLNKYDLRTYRSWSSYEAECYPRDWEMLYKRICGGRSSRDCWSMGRQRCMGLFCKTWDSHRESETVLCLPAACDSSTVQRNNCQRPQLYQITTQQMEKANIRRLICSGLRYALLYITAIAERGRGGLPKQKLTAPLGHKEEFCCRGDAVRSFTLKTTCQAAICDLLTFKYQWIMHTS